MANETKQVWSATPQTVISLAATLANAANTYTGLASCTMTEFVNTEAYPDALAVLKIQDTFAAAPTAGGTVELYFTATDIDGTADETPVPAATDIVNLARLVGVWQVDDQDVANLKPTVISLYGIRRGWFYIRNQTGQTISYSTLPTIVIITPFSTGPS